MRALLIAAVLAIAAIGAAADNAVVGAKFVSCSG